MNLDQDIEKLELKGLKEQKSLADELLQKADAKGLYDLCMKVFDDEIKLVRTLGVLMDHSPLTQMAMRQTPDTDSIDSIKEVAMEAISLAKMVLQSNGLGKEKQSLADSKTAKK